MIYGAKGIIIQSDSFRTLLFVNGITYLIHTYEKIAEPGTENVHLFTYFQVQEAAMSLFGFKNEKELELFTRIISLHQIGPLGAMKILRAMNPESIIKNIESGNVSALSSTKGIGPKTAVKIITGLSEYYKKDDEHRVASIMSAAANMISQAEVGLKGLGFKSSDISKAIKEILLTENENITVESLIKDSIQILRGQNEDR